jgi:hypothetical protein
MQPPNSFGAPAIPGPILPEKEKFFQIVDSVSVRGNRRFYSRDTIPELELANTFYSSGGRWPSRGWILMRRGDYVQLNPYDTGLQLKMGNFAPDIPDVTLQGLCITQARCVTTGEPNDPDAIYLVQIADGQGILYNPWFQFPTTSQYNVVAPAYPGTYYANTLNAGVPWTWSTMIGDLWSQCIPFLDPYPGLPIVPTGTPENWSFVGVPLWEALNRILDYLGLTIANDLTNANPTSVVVAGAADLVFAAQQVKFRNRLEDDFQWIDTGASRVPGTIIVLFHRRNQFYGTEETVRNDSLQWQTTPLYQVPVVSPSPYNAAPGKAMIWADFTVRYDVNNNPLAADTATAATIATERATQFLNTIIRGTSGYMRQLYTGAVPFATGSQVDGIRWMHGSYTSRDGSERFGWRTEIIRGYYWDEVAFSPSGFNIKGPQI